ncbi:hypothetical protein [Actinomadura nitritigenes]|uniref:hypothetical protein n=1 Tax=Actinomadura nitritigenes TaxID=134602 RepID=UPI003D9082EC
MPTTVRLLLLLIAAICLALATLGVAHPRVNLVAAGPLAWVLVPLLDTMHTLD